MFLPPRNCTCNYINNIIRIYLCDIYPLKNTYVVALSPQGGEKFLLANVSELTKIREGEIEG